TSLMAIEPSSCAGVLAKEPLNEPTAVRAALATTIDSEAGIFVSRVGGKRSLCLLALSRGQVKPEMTGRRCREPRAPSVRATVSDHARRLPSPDWPAQIPHCTKRFQ